MLKSLLVVIAPMLTLSLPVSVTIKINPSGPYVNKTVVNATTWISVDNDASSVGHIAPMERCTHNDQCASSNCEHRDDGTVSGSDDLVCCPGDFFSGSSLHHFCVLTNTPFGKEPGEVCQYDRSCKTGNCQSEGSASYCEYLPDATNDAGDDHEANCDGDWQCKPTSRCEPCRACPRSFSTPNRCYAKAGAKAGDSCATDEQCEEGLFCNTLISASHSSVTGGSCQHSFYSDYKDRLASTNPEDMDKWSTAISHSIDDDYTTGYKKGKAQTFSGEGTCAAPPSFSGEGRICIPSCDIPLELKPKDDADRKCKLEVEIAPYFNKGSYMWSTGEAEYPGTREYAISAEGALDIVVKPDRDCKYGPNMKLEEFAKRAKMFTIDSEFGPFFVNALARLTGTVSFSTVGEFGIAIPFSQHALCVRERSMGGDGKTGKAVSHPAFGDCVMQQGSNSVIWGKPRFVFQAGVDVTAQLNFELGLELAYADILMVALAAKTGIDITAKAKGGANATGSGFLDQMEALTLTMTFGVDFEAGVQMPKWFAPAGRLLDICQEDSSRTDAYEEQFPSAFVDVSIYGPKDIFKCDLLTDKGCFGSAMPQVDYELDADGRAMVSTHHVQTGKFLYKRKLSRMMHNELVAANGRGRLISASVISK